MSLRKPKIEYGANFSKTLTFEYPVDNWSAYSSPREGSDFVYTLGGVEDSWIVGTDYYLEAQIRWIPTVSGSFSGWEGDPGFDDFLEFARTKAPFKWYPDATVTGSITSYLVDPLEGGASLEPDGTKSITLLIRNTGSAYLGY
jgi:hypothetical protein